MAKKDEREVWAEENPETVQAWLGTVAKNTRGIYLEHLHKYHAWLQTNGGDLAGKSLDELMDLQAEATGRSGRRKQLDLLMRYIRGFGYTKKASEDIIYYSVRSFYEFNDAPLPKRKRQAKNEEETPIEKSMSVDELRKIVLTSNKTYRAVFLTMFEGGLGEQEMIRFNASWDQIKTQILTKNRLMVELSGRKKNKTRYYTIIGAEATRTLKEYLTTIRGVIGDGEPIFLNDKGNPITKSNIREMFTELGIKSGVITPPTRKCLEPECGGALKVSRKWVNKKLGTTLRCLKCGKVYTLAETPQLCLPKSVRYPQHVHEMRDLFRTEWQKSGADVTVAEFIMGHKVDHLGYNKAMEDRQWAMGQYEKAEPWLNLLSETDPRKVDRVELELQQKQIDEMQEAFREEFQKQLGELDKIKAEMKAELATMREGATSELDLKTYGVDEEDPSGGEDPWKGFTPEPTEKRRARLRKALLLQLKHLEG